MRYFQYCLFLIVIAGFAVCFASCTQNVQAKSGSYKGFALMEMFTSEGCSSCPPAAETAELLDKFAVQAGIKLIILDFHVDYWDYLGWKDRFADPSYTKRQEKYSNALRLESIYTPQSIVNGCKQFTGSNFEKLKSCIYESSETPDACNLKISAVEKTKGGFEISYESRSLPEGTILNIALTEDKTESNVTQGENANKKLVHHDVVRAFASFNMTETKGIIKLNTSLSNINSGYKIVAFIQDSKSFRVLSAARFTLNLK